MRISNFENLQLWQESTASVLELYQHIKDCKDLNIKDQIQRLAAAIASNIDQAFEIQAGQENIQLFSKALRLCTELKSQLYTAKDNYVLTTAKADLMIEKTRQISSVLYKLIHYKKRAVHPLFNPSMNFV